MSDSISQEVSVSKGEANGSENGQNDKKADDFHSYKGAECLILDEYMLPEPEGPKEKKPNVGDKKRGQNKKRPVYKEKFADKLCHYFIDVSPDEPEPKCQFSGNCQFQHDVVAYLAKKQPDIGPECYNFNTFGHCSQGVKCRYGSSHIDKETGRNIVNKDLFSGRTAKDNEAKKNLMVSLRKNQYNFKKADKLTDTAFKVFNEEKKSDEASKNGDTTEPKEKENGEPEQKKAKIENDEPKVGCITDEDMIALKPREKKKLDWSDKLYLAPLTTVGNLPFRRICKEYGADITCSEMALALPILQGNKSEWALLRKHQSEDFFGLQLCGSSPHQMSRVAQLVEQEIECDFVDINMGCPIDLIYNKGMGSGLMTRKRPLEVLTRTMSAILSRPLTIKMRTGVYKDKNIAHNLFPRLEQLGVSALTIHGRSREQRYTRLADWDYINECRNTVQIPVFGNGDILNYEDYYAKKELSGVSGIMIARGALIKPWIFTEIKEKRHWDISAQERLDMVKKYAHYGLEHWGSDDFGVETTRRFLLEWLSFLYRYVPHGILKSPPQRINERIPGAFRGRDDLETMLSSPDCKDWVKITEMFLGKVKPDFEFLPKHKANSY